MRTATVKVDEDVRGVLARATIEGFLLKLPEELPRPLYVKTNKVLEAAGGKWDRRRGGHVFNIDPRPSLGMAVAGELVDEKKTRQAFFTPEPVAAQLARLLVENMHPILGVLEPSAGEGAIARAVRAVAPAVDITCIEIDTSACVVLRQLGFLVHGGDFMDFWAPGTPTRARPLPFFDAVVMNPPFTNGQDVEHVVHAWSFVRRGGVLLAIVAPTFATRRGEKWDRFRDLHDRHAAIDDITLPAGTFAESGTQVTTKIIMWRKPA